MSVFKIFILLVFNRECMERAQNDQNDQFFLPFCVNCSQVAMFQIMAALCPHGQGEGGGSQKFPNLCGHLLWMTPMSTTVIDVIVIIRYID